MFTGIFLLPCKILPKISSLPFIKVAKKQFSDFLAPSLCIFKKLLSFVQVNMRKLDQMKIITF